MLYLGIALCALLLSLERITYVWVSHRPSHWQAMCQQPPLNALGRDPVTVVRRLFIGFKALQIGVFFTWCMIAGATLLPWPTAPPVVIAGGLTGVIAGQILSTAVFQQLGSTAVFFGGELGYASGRVDGFPFNLMPHPQYVGALVSIWGFFLIMRYPNPDWLILPLVETAFYAAGAYLEP